MPGWTGTLDATLAALVSAFKGALAGNPEAVVSDGPTVGDVATSQLLTVGYQASSTDDLAATVQSQSEGWGGSPERESYDVFCSASAFAGDDDQAVPRALAFDLYATACEAVRVDPTLGGVVLRAVPGGYSLHQSATPNGRVATVQFAITVDAYTA